VTGGVPPDEDIGASSTFIAKLYAAAWEADVNCPGEEALLAFALDELPEGQRRSIAAHLEGCEDCGREIEAWGAAASPWLGEAGARRFDAFQRRVSGALERAVRSESGAPWRGVVRQLFEWFMRVGLIPAMGAALVALTGLTLYQGGRLVERDSAAQARLAEEQATALLREAMLENLQLQQGWAVASGRAPNGQAIAASLRNFDLVQLPRASGGAYVLPTVLRVSGEASALGASLDRDPGLRAEVDDYTQHFSDALLPLSDELVEAGRVEQARRLFGYLRRQYDDPSYWLAEAEMCKQVQDHIGAIAIYEEMIRRGMAKSDPRPYHYAGYSYATIGDSQKALEYYDRALAIAPNYAKVFYNKAILYRSLPGLAPAERERLYKENMGRAQAATEQAYDTEGDSNPRITFQMAILAAAQGDTRGRERALDFLERAMQWERAYVVRAQAEPAFEYFRDPGHEPDHTRFQQLIERYRLRPSRFGARQEPYDPKVFVE
jgi:tetratricopeptide (TPR) repeat protein